MTEATGVALKLSAQDSAYLQQILARTVPRLRDTPTFAPMTAFLKDLMARLAKGERAFTLERKEARYLRRTVRAARAYMAQQAATPGGGMMQSQLTLCRPLFEQLLGPARDGQP